MDTKSIRVFRAFKVLISRCGVTDSSSIDPTSSLRSFYLPDPQHSPSLTRNPLHLQLRQKPGTLSNRFSCFFFFLFLNYNHNLDFHAQAIFGREQYCLADDKQNLKRKLGRLELEMFI